MSNPQKDGPWVLVPSDKAALIRSVDPDNLPSPLNGTLVQILRDKGTGLGIKECRSLIAKARRWNRMSSEDRMSMLMADSMTYASLARAAARVVKVELDG